MFGTPGGPCLFLKIPVSSAIKARRYASALWWATNHLLEQYTVPRPPSRQTPPLISTVCYWICVENQISHLCERNLSNQHAVIVQLNVCAWPKPQGHAASRVETTITSSKLMTGPSQWFALYCPSPQYLPPDQASHDMFESISLNKVTSPLMDPDRAVLLKAWARQQWNRNGGACFCFGH